MIDLTQTIKEFASDLPEMTQGSEADKFNHLSATLSGETDLGKQLQEAFTHLDREIETYSKSPMPGTTPQPTPEPTNSNRNSPSFSRS